LKFGPRLPDEDNLGLGGFLHQHQIVESETGNHAIIILTSQPQDMGKIPIIFDITVSFAGEAEPLDWVWVTTRLSSLRDLKNRIFHESLTPDCAQLFQ